MKKDGTQNGMGPRLRWWCSLGSHRKGARRKRTITLLPTIGMHTHLSKIVNKQGYTVLMQATTKMCCPLAQPYVNLRK
jgi:hypothetical protein